MLCLFFSYGIVLLPQSHGLSEEHDGHAAQGDDDQDALDAELAAVHVGAAAAGLQRAMIAMLLTTHCACAVPPARPRASPW